MEMGVYFQMWLTAEHVAKCIELRLVISAVSLEGGVQKKTKKEPRLGLGWGMLSNKTKL